MKHLISYSVGICRPVSTTLFEWRFIGVLIVARNCMLAGYLITITHGVLFPNPFS